MAQTDTSPVLLTKSQVQLGAELLARVFQPDPMMQYLVADTSRLLDKPMRFYRAAIQMGLIYGAVHTTPAMDGIAVWISPGHTDFTFGQLLRSGFLTATLSMGLKSLARFMQSAGYVENLKKQTITDPHWLLLFLGVEPSQQGKGLGATLMQPILDRADAEGIPYYLESTNERNLTFYKRHGFKVSTQGQVPKDGPQIWFMLREPHRQLHRAKLVP